MKSEIGPWVPFCLRFPVKSWDYGFKFTWVLQPASIVACTRGLLNKLVEIVCRRLATKFGEKKGSAWSGKSVGGSALSVLELRRRRHLGPLSNKRLETPPNCHGTNLYEFNALKPSTQLDVATGFTSDVPEESEERTQPWMLDSGMN